MELSNLDSGPMVSILTPSFNQALWLKSNLYSVSNQTYERVEHVVFDGGSTDDSVSVLANHPDPRLIWTSETDRGQSHALNKAYSRSSGEIIGWLNSDDAYVDSRSIAAAVQCFEENPRVGLVYGHSLLVNGADEVLQVLWAPSANQSLRKYLTVFYQPAVFFRRSLIEGDLVNEDLQFVMDFDLWQRIYRTGCDLQRIDLIVGLERHQAARKVLQPEYFAERDAYAASADIPRSSIRFRAIRKSATVSFRLMGARLAYVGPSTVTPATSLLWPSRMTRLMRQLLMPRSRMPLNSAP